MTFHVSWHTWRWSCGPTLEFTSRFHGHRVATVLLKEADINADNIRLAYMLLEERTVEAEHRINRCSE